MAINVSENTKTALLFAAAALVALYVKDAVDLGVTAVSNAMKARKEAKA